MSRRISLKDLTDIAALSELLISRGLSSSAAPEKGRLFAAAAGTLLRAGLSEDSPTRAFFVPGRIEVLGKHTDYAGGRSIIATTERGFCTVGVDRDDATVRIFADDTEDKTEFQIRPDLTPAIGYWSNYAMTVARRVSRNFSGPLCGADIAFRNDLPPAAGMSSSSALLVSNYFVLGGVNNLEEREEYRSNIDSPESLGGYLGTIENGQTFGTLAGDKGVGTFGGSEDHTAMLCCRSGQLSQYSYCPVRLERRIDLPEGYVFAIASSGVAAEKTGSAREKYNRAAGLAREAVDVWNEATARDDPHLAAAVAGEPNAPDRIRKVLAAAKAQRFPPEQLVQRFEHFLAESEQIIPTAGDALVSGDIEEFARQVDRSQELADTLLGNQVDETIFLARCAREIGAQAGSAFGAGFGGSVWALVETPTAEEMILEWADRYRKAFPRAAAGSHFFITRPGPAAMTL